MANVFSLDNRHPAVRFVTPSTGTGKEDTTRIRKGDEKRVLSRKGGVRALAIAK
jgi:hypothetical protein